MGKSKRQHSDRFKRVKNRWRRPKGGQSKQRLEKKGKPGKPCVGKRKPAEKRGTHPSGYEEKLVHNTEEVKKINPEKFAVRIGSKVGKRKRIAIQEECGKRGIKVLNPEGKE